MVKTYGSITITDVEDSKPISIHNSVPTFTYNSDGWPHANQETQLTLSSDTVDVTAPTWTAQGLTLLSENPITLTPDAFNRVWYSAHKDSDLKRLRSVCYGNGYWVFGDNYGYITYSSDGKTWTTTANPVFPQKHGTNDTITGLAYANKRFVAVSDFGRIFVADTPDLWECVYETSSGEDASWSAVATNKIGFVVVGDKESIGAIMYSQNGTSWSDVTPSNSNQLTDANKLSAICFDGTQYCAVSQAYEIENEDKTKKKIPGYVYTSNDGSLWGKISTLPDDTFVPMCINFVNNMYVICGGYDARDENNNIIGKRGKMMYSTDNMTGWTTCTLPNEDVSYVRSVISAYGTMYTVSYTNYTTPSTGEIWISKDGINWEECYKEQNGLLWVASYAEGKVIVGGDYRGIYYNNPDSITITASAGGFTDETTISRSVGNNFVRTNDGGTVLYYLKEGDKTVPSVDASGWSSSLPKHLTNESNLYMWTTKRTIWSDGEVTYEPNPPDLLSPMEMVNKYAQERGITIAEWCQENNITIIDGSTILSGSIDTVQLAASAITTEKIAAGAITAAKIDAGAITAEQIDVKNVFADSDFQVAIRNTIDIGGRNLLLNTGGNQDIVLDGSIVATIGLDSYSIENGVITMNARTSSDEIYYRFMKPGSSMSNLYTLQAGETYTFSGKAKVSTTSGLFTSLNVRSQRCKSNSWGGGISKAILSEDSSTWVPFSQTFTIEPDAEGYYLSIQLMRTQTDFYQGTIQLCDLKLEKGNKATDWTPAPEDMADKEKIITAINASKEGVQIRGEFIDIAGNTTFSSLTTTDNGQTVINGGMIDAKNLHVNAANIDGYLDAAQINVDGFSRNLAKTSCVSHTNSDIETLTAYSWRMTKDEMYTGTAISSSIFEIGKQYTISYRFKKTAGTLNGIGGHSAAFTINRFTIDGAASSMHYNNPAGNIGNNINEHYVVVCVTYNGKQSDNNFYIQPNRGDATSVTYELWNIQVEEGTSATSWTRPLDDVMSVGEFGGWHIMPEAIYTCANGLFSGMCSPMRNIASQNLAFTSNEDGTCYVSGIGTCTDVNLLIPSVSPAGDIVTAIGANAFQNNTNIQRVVIPNSVLSIGQKAFENCTSLNNIIIPDSVTTIGGSTVFLGCKSLTEIRIPSSVTTVGYNIFGSCEKLTIYCEHTSQPSVGWNTSWNDANRPVVWNYKNVPNSLAIPGAISLPRFFAGATDDAPTQWYESNFLVLEDGSLYASAAKISGEINAESGNFSGNIYASAGTIGNFTISTITENDKTYGGLTSDTLSIMPDSIYFKTQSSLNLGNFAYLQDTASATEIYTTGTKNFKLRNADGGGFLFLANQTQQSSSKELKLSNVRYKKDNPMSAGASYGHHILLTITAGNHTAEVFSEDKVITMSIKYPKLSWGTYKDEYMTTTVKLDAGTHSKDIDIQLPGTTSDPGSNKFAWKVTDPTPDAGAGDYGTTSAFTFTIPIASGTNNVVYSLGSLMPEETQSGKLFLGDSTHQWKSLVVGSFSQTGSDKKIKKDIGRLGEQYNSLFDDLAPVKFKYTNGDSDRYHVGFVAQDVESSIQKSGLTNLDFAGLCISDPNDTENSSYTLRYEEFIALCVDQIQKLKKRVEELENKLNDTK